jgi:hypothetical protein
MKETLDLWPPLPIVITASPYKKWSVGNIIVASSIPQGFIPTVEHLYILEGQLDVSDVFQDEIENSQWLEFLRPFTDVKNLYMASEMVTFVAPALQELVGESVTEVLPALQTLFLEEPLSSGSAIDQFVAARQSASRPITISGWEREEEELFALDWLQRPITVYFNIMMI